ncbi:MAG: DUF4835 family protein [bacterium]|nr:DUF4835 family protein [bacterium]
MKKFVVMTTMTLCSMFSPLTGVGQELNCAVEINTDKVQNANKEVFSTLQSAISDYMNTQRWTDAQFGKNEKIDCRLYFTINKYEEPNITADLQIQSTRPVYNSTYTTTLINFKDTKVEFTYENNEPLVFSEINWESNLTAVLNFYAYLIIAIDFDTFSPNGGDPYYEKAATVVRMAQSEGESGWKAFEDTKNRSAVLSAFTDKTTSGIREVLYDYHRKGLDEMVLSPDKGRMAITQTLNTLKKVYDLAPMSVCLTMFKDAKMDELVNVYSKASRTEKDNVHDILKDMYPAEGTRLKKIKEENEKE